MMYDESSKVLGENVMEKKAKVTKSVKAKRATPASKARFQMIKDAAMKFASQRKPKVVAAKKTATVAAKKKKPKGRIGIPLRKDRQARRDATAAELLTSTTV